MVEIWRTGRHNRPHIYRQIGDDPHDDDTWVGHMDTPELAATVVDAVNAWNAQHTAKEPT